MSDPAFITPEEIEARRVAEDKAARRISAQLSRDYAERFGGAAGERVLADLINQFDDDAYTRGDPQHTFYCEGRRAVIKHITQSIGRAEQQTQENANYDD